MRTTLLLATLTTIVAGSAVPAIAQSSIGVQQTVENDDQPRGDRWEDRWRGRQHILYDEAEQNSTVGQASEAQASCRAYAMRLKRADGSTAVRRETRCD